MVNERGAANRLFSAHGFSATAPISPLCGALWWQLQDPKLHLSGSVPLLGLCTAYLPGRSSRHQSLSSCPATQALSYGLPGCDFSQQPRLHQRASRLEDLRRFRPGSDWHGPRPLSRRTVRSGIVRDRICPRLHDHRFVPVAFSVGKIPSPQECRETAHTVGSARQHSDQCLCDRRPSPRREHSGPTASRSRSVLLARSRLCGLCSPVFLHPRLCLLHYSRQKEYAVPPSLLAPRRPIRRTALRPDDSADRSPHCSALSRSLATYPLFRCREGLPTNLPDQQFSPARLDYHPVVPGTLESGIVFSLDQTAPAHQGFLRHLGERGKDSSVGRPLSLRLGGDRQKATRARAKPLQNSANSQCDDFRKNPDIRGVFQLQR